MGVLRIKELMNQKGMNREDLAKKVGVSITTISNISTETNLPSIERLLQIAEVMDVDIREMFIPTKGSLITQSEVEEAKSVIGKALRILEGKQ